MVQQIPDGEAKAVGHETLQGELGSEFELVKRLGGGALSSVYLAREPALRRLVAIKVLHPEAARHPKRLTRFRREARALARVSHPAVVSIFRVGDLSSAVPYLIMQYVRGTDLAERLSRHGPLEPSAAARLLATLSRALGAVHGHGIVHRDVRPESVLCELDSDRVLLADFGLAAYLDEAESGPEDVRLTTAGHVITDLRSTAPELLAGDRPTPASDVYALGVLGYRVLTGSDPYRAASDAALARAHRTQEPLSMRALGVAVPAELEELLLACVAKRPHDRPGVEDLARALDGLSSGRPAAAERPVSAEAPERVPGREAAETRYRMRLLGRLELESKSGGISDLLGQPKRAALLAFLACQQAAGYTRRDRLIGVFWPDSTSDSARHSLRQSLYVLRRELGEDVLITRGDDEVGLDTAAFWCDVSCFDERAREGRASEALALYEGDLLPGFYLDDAPDFERWLDVERVRLRREAAALSWEVAREKRAAGDGVEARRWARAAVDLDPFDEAGLHALIEMLDELGDRAGALRAYDHFATRLEEEYAAEPSPETRRLISRVRDRE